MSEAPSTVAARCLNCRGGRAGWWQLDENGHCLLCHEPVEVPSNEHVAYSRLAELKALSKTYRLQLGTRDDLRSFTLQRMLAQVNALIALDKGETEIGPGSPDLPEAGSGSGEPTAPSAL